MIKPLLHISSTTTTTTTAVDDEVLKRRQERFGVIAKEESPLSGSKVGGTGKLAERANRFGLNQAKNGVEKSTVVNVNRTLLKF